jgi:hypothetical protein
LTDVQRQALVGGQEFDLHVAARLGHHDHAGHGVLDLHGRIGGGGPGEAQGGGRSGQEQKSAHRYSLEAKRLLRES